MAGDFPYKRETSIDPYPFLITGPNQALVPTQIDKTALADKGVETFRFCNPAKCWVWLRGWLVNDPNAPANYTDVVGKGLLFPPGAVEIMKTQYPDFIVVVAANIPDVPIIDANGNYLFPNRYCYNGYGGGF